MLFTIVVTFIRLEEPPPPILNVVLSVESFYSVLTQCIENPDFLAAIINKTTFTYSEVLEIIKHFDIIQESATQLLKFTEMELRAVKSGSSVVSSFIAQRPSSLSLELYHPKF